MLFRGAWQPARSLTDSGGVVVLAFLFAVYHDFAFRSAIFRV